MPKTQCPPFRISFKFCKVFARFNILNNVYNHLGSYPNKFTDSSIRSACESQESSKAVISSFAALSRTSGGNDSQGHCSKFTMSKHSIYYRRYKLRLRHLPNYSGGYRLTLNLKVLIVHCILENPNADFLQFSSMILLCQRVLPLSFRFVRDSFLPHQHTRKHIV